MGLRFCSRLDDATCRRSDVKSLTFASQILFADQGNGAHNRMGLPFTNNFSLEGW